MHAQDPQPRATDTAAMIRLRRNGAAAAFLVLTAVAILMIMGSHDEPEAWRVYSGGLAVADAAAVMIVAIGALHGHAAIVDTQETTNDLLRQVLANQAANSEDLAAVRAELGELRSEVARARDDSAEVSERLAVTEQHLGARLDTVAHRTREQNAVITEVLASNVRRIGGGGLTEPTPPGGTPRHR